MGLLDKIDEITTNGVTPEEFKKTWGYSIKEYVDDMNDFMRELEAEEAAEEEPIADKTERRVVAALPAAAVKPAAATTKVAAKAADVELEIQLPAARIQSPIYGAVARARQKRQESERLVKVAKSGGGIVECHITGKEPLRIYVFSKQRNDGSKKKYVYTVSLGSISTSGDVIRTLCEQIAEMVSAREKQQKLRYGGYRPGITSLFKMAKMRKMLRLGKPTPALDRTTMMEAVDTEEGLKLVEVLNGGGLMKQRNVKKGRKGGPKGGGILGGPK